MFGIVALLSLGMMGFGVIQKLKVVDHFGRSTNISFWIAFFSERPVNIGFGRFTPPFVNRLPRFLAEVWLIFNEYEIAGYVASLRPKPRKTLRNLRYLR